MPETRGARDEGCRRQRVPGTGDAGSTTLGSALPADFHRWNLGDTRAGGHLLEQMACGAAGFETRLCHFPSMCCCPPVELGLLICKMEPRFPPWGTATRTTQQAPRTTVRAAGGGLVF